MISDRELLVDKIFVFLQILSRGLFLIFGLIGYKTGTFYGAVFGVALGLFLGVWMRYSMGRRGKDPFHGYYRRIQERANGSRRGVFEFLLEKGRGNELTREKCIRISEEYRKAMSRLNGTRDREGRIGVLQELDRATKQISYDKAQQ